MSKPQACSSQLKKNQKRKKELKEENPIENEVTDSNLSHEKENE